MLTVFQDLGDDFAGVGIAKHRAGRDRHDHIGPRAAGLVGAHSMLATLGNPLVAVGVVEEGCQVGITANNDAAASPAITAVGPAHRGAPLAAERSAS